MLESYYIAYGSNLNFDHMKRRCPTARFVGTSIIEGYRLAFRGCATLEPVPEASAPVGIWMIDRNAEQALDRYEGFPVYYRKEYLKITLDGEEITAMAYIMNENMHSYSRPTDIYFNTVVQGYRDTGLDEIYLYEALSR